jgi:hypothetical protein
MNLRKRALVIALVAMSALTMRNGTVSAAGIFLDPAGDFLPSFTGPANGDLDILSGSVRYNDTYLLLSSTMNGPVGTTEGSLFLWGVDRGSGTPLLTTSGPPAVGPDTILLDAVVRLNGNGTGAVLTFPPMGAPTTTLLDSALISISGNTLSASIPRDLLFSTGFAFEHYTYIHWSRSAFGPQEFIADLAPDAASFQATAVPEPASGAMMILGCGLVGAALRRRPDDRKP